MSTSSYTIPISSLSRQKNEQLALSATNPPMYLIINHFEFDKVLSTYLYEIEIGIQSQHDVVVHKIITRYSVLKNMNQNLKQIFKNSPFEPQFPPSKLFFKNDEEFIKKRAQDLQTYLSQLTKIPGVQAHPMFIDVFKTDKN